MDFKLPLLGWGDISKRAPIAVQKCHISKWVRLQDEEGDTVTEPAKGVS